MNYPTTARDTQAQAAIAKLGILQTALVRQRMKKVQDQITALAAKDDFESLQKLFDINAALARLLAEHGVDIQ